MAEDKDSSESFESSPPTPRFLEVICRSSGKTRRFAPGVKSGFALSLINQKLDSGSPLSMYIEAAKKGEEPIIFGPNSLLINYGEGWTLQAVVFSEGIYGTTTGAPDIVGLNTSQSMGKVSQPISFVYILRILLAFALIFLLAAIFTVALENLPRLILLINSVLSY